MLQFTLDKSTGKVIDFEQTGSESMISNLNDGQIKTIKFQIEQLRGYSNTFEMVIVNSPNSYGTHVRMFAGEVELVYNTIDSHFYASKTINNKVYTTSHRTHWIAVNEACYYKPTLSI